MTAEDIDASKAPLIEHLVELRARLIKSLLAFLVMFFVDNVDARFLIFLCKIFSRACL